VLLGWADGDPLNELSDVDVDSVDEMKAFADDDSLRGWVLQATEERVAPEIVTSAGLYAVRHLAATLLVDDESLAPADALISLLNAMHDCVGSRPRQWLNSLALIGKRIVAEQYLEGADALLTDHPGSPPEPFGLCLMLTVPKCFQHYGAETAGCTSSYSTKPRPMAPLRPRLPRSWPTC
jgi:hypothetical protein